MPRPIEEPVVTTEKWGSGEEIKTTHPAFAQIAASRVNGSTVLYGSDFVHYAAIRIRIHTSTQYRSLAHDRYHERENLVEVELSEAQWAHFISSLNMGSGSPCTLTSLGGKMVPGLPGSSVHRRYLQERHR